MGVSLGNIEKTAGPRIAGPARVILGELTKSGIDPDKQPMETILVLDHSGSMWDEYDDGLVQRAVERGLAFGATVDPDGKAQAVYFDSRAHEAPEIDLHNFNGWVNETRPKNMGSTNLADAMGMTLQVAARTLGVPGIAELTRGRVEVERKSGFGRRGKEVYTAYNMRPVQAARPVFALLITDGEPNDKVEAKKMLVRASYAPIFWKILFVSNDSDGRDFLQELDDMEGRLVDNAVTVFFTNGLGSVTDQNFGVEVVRELDTWLADARRAGLLV